MESILTNYRNRLINLSAGNRTLVLKKLYKKRAFDLKRIDIIPAMKAEVKKAAEQADKAAEEVDNIIENKDIIDASDEEDYNSEIIIDGIDKETADTIHEAGDISINADDGEEVDCIEEIPIPGLADIIMNALLERRSSRIELLPSPYEKGLSIEVSDEIIKQGKSLKTLLRQIKAIEMEKGSYELNVGFPFVEGWFNDGSFVKAPLLLFPVELMKIRDKWYIKGINDEDIILNRTFIVAYQRFNELKLDEFQYEFESIPLQKDEDGNDKPLHLWLLDYLNKNGIEIETNGFESIVNEFNEYTAKTLPPARAGELHMVNNLVIGQFPVSTSALYEDYNKMIEAPPCMGLVPGILMTDSSELEPADLKISGFKDDNAVKTQHESNAETYYVTKLDDSQETAIEKARNNGEMVVYGPPGTGKSQVIVNMITDQLARGKKVLMVSQKKAAIDVVYNRLSAFGLKERIGFVEDVNRDRSSLYANILEVLDKFEDHIPFDDINNHNVITGLIDGEIDRMGNLAELLHQEQEFGMSLQQLYIKSDNDESKIIESISDTFDDYQHINIKQLDEMLLLIDRIVPRFYYDFNDCSIKNRKSFGNLSVMEAPRIGRNLRSSENIADKYLTAVDNYEKVHEMQNILMEKGYGLLDVMENELDDDVDKLSGFGSLLPDRLLPFLSDLTEWTDALRNKKWTKGDWWHCLYLIKHTVGKGRIWNILRDIENTALYVDYINTMKQKYGFTDIEVTTDTVFIINKFDEYRITYNLIHNLWNDFSILSRYFKDMQREKIITMIFLNEDWRCFIDDGCKLIESDYEHIRDYDYRRAAINDDAEGILMKGLMKYGQDMNVLMGLTDAIRNTFCIKHIEKLEMEYHSIVADIGLIDIIRDRVVNLMDRKRAMVPNIIMDKLNEGMEQSKAYNRVGNEINFKNMRYEAGKKRRRMILRQFVHHFYDKGIFSVLPCWLVTPEVVSSLFPLYEDIFDVVVFDEASQMFVENAIPALFRSKRAMIAGDDKQLQPFDLYMVRWSENGEEDEDGPGKAELEVKSLLDLAKYRYGETHLNYHYRSHWEELISFSNYGFYRGNLETVPNREIKRDDTPIERIMVDGYWIDRRNVREAEAVTELIGNILKDSIEKPSIGVITFNVTQKDLIYETIDDRMDEDEEFADLFREAAIKGDVDSERLFIKNIENVQGDERDIIIFSVGYAPDENGKVSRNFGSLTLKSGENRLNVAVSRARQKIYMVTSIEPEQLGDVSSLSMGAVYLKSYLEYARAVSKGDDDDVARILKKLYGGKTEKEHEETIGQMEESIRITLENMGYRVDSMVGQSEYKIDLAVYDYASQGYIAGIETDGRIYKNACSAKARDVYRQEFLKSRGWKVKRAWSRDYWLNPQEQMNGIAEWIRQIADQTKTNDEETLPGEVWL